MLVGSFARALFLVHSEVRVGPGSLQLCSHNEITWVHLLQERFLAESRGRGRGSAPPGVQIHPQCCRLHWMGVWQVPSTCMLQCSPMNSSNRPVGV